MITRMPKKKKSLATNNCRHYKKTMKVGVCTLDSLSLVFPLHCYCFQASTDSLSLAFCLTLLPFSGDSKSAKTFYIEIYAYLVKQAIKVLI